MLIGSDQCFPACLPVDDREECIRIVRVEVEDGSLLEVTYALADAIVNTSIQDGTVFLLGSVSHLSKSGTQQYITDWIRSRLWLRNRLVRSAWCCIYSRSQRKESVVNAQ